MAFFIYIIYDYAVKVNKKIGQPQKKLPYRVFIGGHGLNRTSDPQIFSLLLLPTELHDHGGELEIRTLETLPAPACFQDKCHRPTRPTLQVCGVAYSAAMVVFGTTMKATAYRRGNKHWRDNPVPTRILIIYKYVPLSRRTQFPIGYLSHVGYLCRDLNPHRSIISQLP